MKILHKDSTLLVVISTLMCVGLLLIVTYIMTASYVSGQTAVYDLSDAPLTPEEWEEIHNLDPEERAQAMQELREQYGRQLSAEEMKEREEKQRQEQEQTTQVIADSYPSEQREHIIQKEARANTLLTALHETSTDMILWHTALGERFKHITERLQSRVEKIENETGATLSSSRSYLETIDELLNEFTQTLESFENSSRETIVFNAFNPTLRQDGKEQILRYASSQEQLFRISQQLVTTMTETIDAVQHEIQVHGDQ